MKKIILFLLTISLIIDVNAQTTKVLFLGNSFTFTFDIPELFKQLSISAGMPVFVDKYSQAGMAVANEQIIGHINDPISQAKIASQQWDYVVVQDNMGDYVNSIGVIPSAVGNANVTLYNQIKANNPCTRIVYFAGWCPEGGVFSGDNTQNCINRIYGNTLFLNNAIGQEIVTPIGKAWNTSLIQMPSVDLYHTDNVHPSLVGSYLAAATIFTSILKRDPTGLTYSAGINTTTAQNLRQIAYNTVINPVIFSETKLNTYTPTISANGNILTSSGSSSLFSFQWFLNNTTPVGSNSNTYTATTQGYYSVTLTNNSSGCPFTSFPVNVTTVGVNFIENDIENNGFLITPISYGNRNYELKSKQLGQITIYNLQGKLIKTYQKLTNNIVVDFSNLTTGMYVVSLVNEYHLFSQKIVIN